MSRVVEVSVTNVMERKVRFLPIFEGSLYAFREERYTDGALTSVREGLTKRVLTSLSGGTEIAESRKALFKAELVELYRTKPLWRGALSEITDREILEPFTYLLDNPYDTTQVRVLQIGDHEIYDENRNRLAKAVHMDYIHGRIDDEYYDLEVVLEVLKKRTDILWIQEGITLLPVYARDDDRDYYLDIVWTPSEKDWERVKHHTHTFELCQAALKNIMGISPKTGG